MTDFLGARDDHDFLSGYLDGELTADERAGVEAQLATSAELRAELADVTAARDAVRGLPRREAPAGFWDAVLATVAADPVEATEGGEAAPVVALDERRRRRARAWRIAGAAAAAAAVVLAVILVPGQRQVRPNVTGAATQHAASSSDLGDSIGPITAAVPLMRPR